MIKVRHVKLLRYKTHQTVCYRKPILSIRMVWFTSGGTRWCDAWAAHRRIFVTSAHRAKEKKSTNTIRERLKAQYATEQMCCWIHWYFYLSDEAGGSAAQTGKSWRGKAAERRKEQNVSSIITMFIITHYRFTQIKEIMLIMRALL